MIQQVINPYNGSLVMERELLSGSIVDAIVERGNTAQKVWKKVPLSERAEVCRRFIEIMLEQKELLGSEITDLMGRPIRYTPNEIVGMADRAQTMIDIAEHSLADVSLPEKQGFHRFIRREPIGLIFAIVPWNYPYLTAINVLVPALLAGNAVIMKHSPQTMICAERLYNAFHEAGLMTSVFQYVHVDNDEAQRILASTLVDHVAFTGSVGVGHEIVKGLSKSFATAGLELGGKDAAYIRSDANLDFTVENIIDGVMFNSGQSCCAVERIYVDTHVYDEFIERAIEITNSYVVGDPNQHSTTLGPMVNGASAEKVRNHIDQAFKAGAIPLIDGSKFGLSNDQTNFVTPQLLTNVEHTMAIMSEETFGPVAGIMRVESDEEAICLINDSRYGLTASIWSEDELKAYSIGDSLNVGTVFMNRCDYLDPLLPWTGVKDSGRGCTLSQVGYEHLTRAKSYHFRTLTE